MAKFKVLTVFGTRPEAIKLAPLVHLLAQEPTIESRFCVTGQHREILDQVLSLFALKPDIDLNLMQPNQDLTSLTVLILQKLRSILTEFQPDLVLVQGDTTTAFATSLACYYQQIPVGHIEAGLRTHHRYSPFPEEGNRRLTSVLADWHFAPTESAKQNLLAENHPAERIIVTGNTVIDALHWVQQHNEKNPPKHTALLPFSSLIKKEQKTQDKKMILVTLHRRENFGEVIEQVCHALIQLAQQPDLHIIFPLHPNPQVQQTVRSLLVGKENIDLIEPQPYFSFIALMQNAYLILTDSGGIQEEAPALAKPVLLLRNFTERPEAVALGAVQVIGTEQQQIIEAVNRLCQNPTEYAQMAQAHHPYGDGNASARILDVIKQLAKNV
ncbi:UDP-N-acetyl glucosamine 2-epimerase [Pasteurellaceae bacterium Pebbles2]|nr:UDP-N-acetyl glucosamine 2-epimerase [Pasteurellaceae bacterium Pebbles2]